MSSFFRKRPPYTPRSEESSDLGDRHSVVIGPAASTQEPYDDLSNEEDIPTLRPASDDDSIPVLGPASDEALIDSRTNIGIEVIAEPETQSQAVPSTLQNALHTIIQDEMRQAEERIQARLQQALEEHLKNR